MSREITRIESSVSARQFSVLLSPTRRGARLARLLTTTQLNAWELPSGAVETAAQIVAELAGNAVLHARAPGRDFRLVLAVTDTDTAVLRIEVTDPRGDRLPATTGEPVPADAETGRGLLLVEALADGWGVKTGPFPRKTVWAELAFVL